MTATSSTPPTTTLETAWGRLTVNCSHPHRVQFTAGFLDDDRLTVNRVAYRCSLTVSRAPFSADDPVARHPIGNPWHVEAAATWHALRREDGTFATDAARDIMTARILPALRRWLDTPEAQELLAAGDAYWRRHVTEAAAATRADLAAALQRLQQITDQVARGEVISRDDERFAAYARALIP